MDDLFRLLPVLLIYLLAASSSSKKKKSAAQRRKRTPAHTPNRMQPDSLRDRAARVLSRDLASQMQTLETVRGSEGEEQCENSPVHLHEVSQQQMAHTQEGEDPCHAGGFRPSEVEEQTDTQHEEQPFAQDVLRGVVMSEILMRPQERRAQQRKRYHG